MLRNLVYGTTVALSMVMTAPSQAATFGDYGDTFNNGSAFDLTSYSSSGSGYSGLYIDNLAPLTLGGITQLSADYNMVGGAFGGGAPRFGIADVNGFQVWAYWGTTPALSNPNANGTWANTGNLANLSSPDVRFYSNGFGGFTSIYPGNTWAEIVAAVGGITVAYVVLDLDGSFTGDQHMLVNNFTVNGDVMTAETPLPAALPLFIGALGAIGFIARRRKNRAASTVS